MPEGPEIAREADRIGAAVVGQTLERVRFGQTRMRRHEPDLVGVRVVSVNARGKALLTRFDDGTTLYTHNQLYGKWYVVAAGKPPRTRRTLRVALEGSQRWALLYSASEIERLDDDGLARHPYLTRLGPDLLAPGTTPARIRKQLLDPRFRNRNLGGLLLDQSFLAGVGNYLRSEILFFAGLRPDARPADLDDDQQALLARTARTVTRRSYRTRGVTELADIAKRAKAAGEPRRRWRHAVFARDGHPCRRCETTIVRFDVASRRLYLCPACQG